MTEHDPNHDVNAWLHSIDDVQPSARLQRVVAEIPLRHPRAAAAPGAEIRWPFASAWRTALAATLVCALGAIVGASNPEDTTTTTLTSDDEGAELAFALSLDAERNEETTP